MRKWELWIEEVENLTERRVRDAACMLGAGHQSASR